MITEAFEDAHLIIDLVISDNEVGFSMEDGIVAKKKTSLETNFSVHLLTDTVAVPKMLLRQYAQLGLNEQELVVLLKVYTAELDCGLEFSAFGEERIVIPGLIKKKYVVIQKRQDGEYLCLEWNTLFDRLLELWVYQQSMQGREGSEASHKVPLSDRKPPQAGEAPDFGKLYQAFEQEFGRGLSPLESEKIMEWLDHLGFREDMILEALKRAVYRGKYSFAYIDKILHDWYRKNIRTPQEIEQSDMDRTGEGVKTGQKRKQKEEAVGKSKTDYSLVYQKK